MKKKICNSEHGRNVSEPSPNCHSVQESSTPQDNPSIKIATTALHLKQFGLNQLTIAAHFKVDDKSVSKAIERINCAITGKRLTTIYLYSQPFTNRVLVTNRVTLPKV